MTRIAFLPFYSQQDKQTGKFLLHSCVATKHVIFMAKKIEEELSWETRLFVPQLKDCQTQPEWHDMPWLDVYEAPIPPENMAQRLEWYPHRWPTLFKGVDILFTSHELIGWAIKGAYPKMKVIQQHNLHPDTAWPWMSPLFDLNYEHVDIITCLSPTMQKYVGRRLQHRFPDYLVDETIVQLWPFAWNMQQLHDPIQSEHWADPERDIDLLFVLRGSSTNYSHHVEFIAALKLLRELGWQGKVYFPDQTRYLTENKLLEGIENVYVQEGTNKNLGAYTRLLRRSKAVIGLCDNGFGGESIREAIACGAFPILLNCDGYTDLVGEDWPGLLSNMGAEYMAGFIQGIFESGLYERATKEQLIRLTRNMNAGEYQAVWARSIKPTLLKLVQG